MTSSSSSPPRDCGRIGLDARPLFFGQQTGVSRYLRNLLAHALKGETGLEFLLYAHTVGPEVHIPAEWKNARLRVVQSPWSGQKRLWENLALPGALRRDRVDIFFSPAYVLPLRLPCPGLVTMHDISYEAHPEWFPPIRSRYIRFFSRRAARQARLILTDSEFSRSEILRHYEVPAEQVRSIPLAADESFFESVPASEVVRVRDQYGLPEKFILYVGSIHQRRQIPEMVRALVAMHRQGETDLRLVLVGHNNFYPPTPLPAIIEDAGGARLVQCIDFVPEPDLRPLYAAADIVAYISRYEGFGLPVIEAMAAGRPVVTANAASLPEVAGDGALLVDPNSVEEIAEAFGRLATDDVLREELVERGRERARQFSWDRTASETMEALRDCVGS